LEKCGNDQTDHARRLLGGFAVVIQSCGISQRSGPVAWNGSPIMNELLAGSSEYLRVVITIDWEYALMVPWMPKSRRIASLIEDGHLPDGRLIDE
jgi:hypothetical protein